jgi:hypothetical protein
MVIESAKLLNQSTAAVSRRFCSGLFQASILGGKARLCVELWPILAGQETILPES